MPGREADVQAVFDALFRALCDDRDVDAFAALWADDPGITMWGSDEHERAVGLVDIRRLGSAIAASERTFRFSWSDRRVFEHGDVAWVNARGVVDADGLRRPYRATAVFVRTRAGWRWHTFSGSIPD